MIWVYNDGGRRAAGYRGKSGDCVTRAIAIAAQRPYQDVYDDLNTASLIERRSKHKKTRSNARTGVWTLTTRRYLNQQNWIWTPTMKIGSGCKVHLRSGELPNGRLIVRLSGHLVAVIDGVIHDIGDPSRGGNRCVYGFWSRSSS